MSFGLEREIVDRATYEKAVRHLKDRGVRLPSISELADPPRHLKSKAEDVAGVDPDIADPGNLFRVHWYNAPDRRGLSDVPAYMVVPQELTGVDAKIVVALGNRFPMINAHKVLAAYGCLVPRLMSGKFDPENHRAVWPSTGNYCRGGVAISRILGCRSVAVLPEGMSAERFNWLENWVTDPSDIVRTHGTESNVKEIYDACHELAKDPANVILNQFSEFSNYIIHRAVTGPALQKIFEDVNKDGNLTARAYVSASGSAGTLAAGDHLKAVLGTDTCAVEALECPTLLYNGFGDHNIQGIGDKHVPFIHNVMATDYVIGVSDHATDGLNVVYNTTAGRNYLSSRLGLGQEAIASLGNLGLSSLANILGAVKYAKYNKLGPDDVVLSVATDGAALYETELGLAESKYFEGGVDEIAAAETFGRYLLGCATDNMIELDRPGKERIFNLGYYTWVEQQGVSLEEFTVRRDQAFWDGLMDLVPAWDGMIADFNAA
ncbi:hypothetical protein L2D14_16915 [Thalassospiraceae bacterium LMO-JJ14]|nr:hypothetical protein L2D14_16915 [Thalassospiraceae bacterium LMO-JJ14]